MPSHRAIQTTLIDTQTGANRTNCKAAAEKMEVEKEAVEKMT
jgi:hypothetical protein